MAKQLKRFKEVEKHFNNADIVHDTTRQIAKDFGSLGFKLELPTHSTRPYAALLNVLKPEMARLLQQNDPRLKGLLYRIDLSENLIMAHEQTRQDWDSAEALTDLIIRREVEKVVWRRWFSA